MSDIELWADAIEVYARLHEAFDAEAGESLAESARRLLAGPPHPAWAAARKVIESATLRDDAAWDALAKAAELLP